MNSVIAFATCCIFSVFLISKGYTQKINVDSLINITKTAPDDTNKVIAFRAVCGLTANTDPRKSMEYGWRGVALAKRINWDKGVAGCYLNLSNAYSNLGKNDTAILILDSALIYSKKVGEDKRTALVYINRAASYIYLSKLEKAMQDALAALPYAESSGDLDRLARVYMTFGNIYFYQKDWINAQKFYQKCIPLFKQIGLNNMVGTATMNLAITYKNRNFLDSAAILTRKSIQIFTLIKDNKNLILAHGNLGTILSIIKSYSEAKLEFKKAINLAESIQDDQQTIANKQSMGEVYYLQKQYTLAESILLPIFDSAVALNFYNEQVEIAETLSAMFAETGQYDLAFKYLQKYNIANDTISKRKQNEALLALQEQYTTEQREKKIALLNTTAALQEKEIQSKNLLNILLGLVFGVALVIGIIIWNRYRLKQELKEVQLRYKIASDLHDDVGATLSSIKMYSEIIKRDELSAQTNTQMLLQKIIENSTESIDNMSDIVWMVKPGNDKMQNLTERIIEYANGMCNSTGLTLHAHIQSDLSDIVLPMELRRDVYLIMKESINNAAKYGKCSNLELNISKIGSNIIAEVIDDGLGFELENTKLGNGLANMQSRAAKHKGKLEIISAPGNGCSIKSIMPIP